MPDQDKTWTKLARTFFVILILLNVLLLHEVFSLKKGKERSSPIDRAHLPTFALRDLEGHLVTSYDLIRRTDLTLLVFFSLADCALCLSEKELWEQIYEDSTDGIDVVGIGQHLDRSELRAWVVNSGITFPVLYDSHGLVTRKIMGIEETPVKLIVDSLGNILYSDSKARPFEDDQQELREEIIRLQTQNSRSGRLSLDDLGN